MSEGPSRVSAPPARAGVEALWPPLPLEDWQETLDTLHLWTQIVGKVALALAPAVNHWWGVTLLPTPRGLATPTLYHGARALRMELDFVEHVLALDVGTERRRLPLRPRPVAEFHADLLATLADLDVEVSISRGPSEIPDPLPFAEDHRHASYDAAAVERFRTAMSTAHRLLDAERATFLGKSSPVHFFWGAFDLAYTRFSGRSAPPHPGGIPNTPDWVTREAYAQEVWSAGWWPGQGGFGRAAFYAYAYPEPAGFAAADPRVRGAYYDTTLREFVLPWEAARTASDPDASVRDFLRATYEAASDLGGWDRAYLERRAEELTELERRIHRGNRPGARASV